MTEGFGETMPSTGTAEGKPRASESGTAGTGAASRPSSWDGGAGPSSKSGRGTVVIGCASKGDDDDELEVASPHGTVDAYLGTWTVLMLMDRREFGQHKGSDFLERAERKINDHFDEHFGGGKAHCERTYLPSADYMFVARLTSHSGTIVDERILPLIIERKDVTDLAQCIKNKSKKYKPLSFFQAQMYKLQNCGISRKLMLIEGDEDDPSQLMYSANRTRVPPSEQEIRRKSVKTKRLQLEKGEYRGVDVISIKSKEDTMRFLIEKLTEFKKSFDPSCLPKLTMDDFKNHLREQLNAPTFREYLRQLSLNRVGHVKAMKVIMSPDLDWDKNFIPPTASSKRTKSTLEDIAVMWGESKTEAAKRHQSNARAAVIRSKKSRGLGPKSSRHGDPVCGICRKAVDIFTETDIATCNRVSACGATFHESCLAKQGYDIRKAKGCILCRGQSKVSVDAQATLKGSMGLNGENAGMIVSRPPDERSRKRSASNLEPSSKKSSANKGCNKGANPKAKRAKKDPDAPKRPIDKNCDDQLQVERERPDASTGEVGSCVCTVSDVSDHSRVVTPTKSPRELNEHGQERKVSAMIEEKNHAKANDDWRHRGAFD